MQTDEMAEQNPKFKEYRHSGTQHGTGQTDDETREGDRFKWSGADE